MTHDIIPNRWVRFLTAWRWEIPEYGGRAHKEFPEGWKGRLTRRQFQSAMAAGVVVSIPSPGFRAIEAEAGDVVDLAAPGRVAGRNVL